MAETLFKRTDDPYRRTAQKYLPPGASSQQGFTVPDVPVQRYRPQIPGMEGNILPRRYPGPGAALPPGSVPNRPPITTGHRRPGPLLPGGELPPAPAWPPPRLGIKRQIPGMEGPILPRRDMPGIPGTEGPILPRRETPGVPGTEAPILPLQEDGPLAPAARLLAQALRGSYGVNPNMLSALQGGRLPQLNTWGQGWGSRLSPMLMQSLMGLYQSGGYRPEEMAWTLGRMAPTAPRYAPAVRF